MMTASADVANCLLNSGADFNSESAEGFTALGAASARGSLAVVRVLLKRGATAHMLTPMQDGVTPLSAAVNNDHEEIAMLLLRQLVLQSDFDINHPRLGLNQPLLCSAVSNKMPRVVELALEHGAAVDIVGPNGPPLRMAVETYQYAIVNLLCEGGADMNTQFLGESGLGTAVRFLDSHMVQTMLRFGADVHAVVGGERITAVEFAALAPAHTMKSKACGVMNLLLAAGATIDPHRQRSLLSVVCNQSSDAEAVQMIELLLPHCSSALIDEVDEISGHTVLSAII
jgi:ankyrin repeat protein